MPHRLSKKPGRVEKANPPSLVIRPSLEQLGTVLRASWGSNCWCMHPRLTDAQMRELPGSGPVKERRRDALKKLARRRRRAPGLIAFEDDEPVGWVAVAPRAELARVDASRATPRVDDEDIWVIPCITVRKTARGRGIAIALIQAAVAYATEKGAPGVEAYPRSGNARTGDDNVYFGTEPLFRRAGFRVIRKPLKNRPRTWLPRVAMRISMSSDHP